MNLIEIYSKHWPQFVFSLGMLVLGMLTQQYIQEMDASYQKERAHKSFQGPAPEKSIKSEPIATPLINVPKPLRPFNELVLHTNYIGNANRPTINGGIINTTELAPLNYIATAYKKEGSEPELSNSSSNAALVSHVIGAGPNISALDEEITYVLQKSQALNLPKTLALIPLVESHYKNNAVSSKGAAGPWQLMPELAKDFGIKTQERFDFKISTNIALNYLSKLYNQFGNWDLAFAAYNAGPGRVQKALNLNPKAIKIEELNLPRETKAYVAKIKRLSASL
jgi:hypothetical protein